MEEAEKYLGMSVGEQSQWHSPTPRPSKIRLVSQSTVVQGSPLSRRTSWALAPHRA
jgi:hypothetical protein